MVLVDQIAAAFRSDPVPDVATLVRAPSREAQQVREFFAGRRWTELTRQLFDNEYAGDPSACLFFLSDSAARYYLPGYLRMVLEGEGELSSTGFATITVLTPPDDPGERREFVRWSSQFTREQASAIERFLRFLADRYKTEFPDPVNGVYRPLAAAAYWSKLARE